MCFSSSITKYQSTNVIDNNINERLDNNLDNLPKICGPGARLFINIFKIQDDKMSNGFKNFIVTLCDRFDNTEKQWFFLVTTQFFLKFSEKTTFNYNIELILAVVIIGYMKIYSDWFWTNKDYYELLQPKYSLKLLNKTEIFYLGVLDYKLYISKYDLREFYRLRAISNESNDSNNSNDSNDYNDSNES